MINTSDRGEAIKLIDEAIAAEPGKPKPAANGLERANLQRWRI